MASLRFGRRKAAPRHALTVARPEQAAAEVPEQEVPAESADYDTSYDDPGWGPEPAPTGDDTMIWRAPGLDGGPGFVIPPGLPQRSPGAAIPPALVPALRTEAADLDLLRDLRDALKALPGDPPPAPARPVAWLRVIEDDGSQAHEALNGPPEFAGTVAMPDGTPVAGLILGCHGRGTWIFDTVDPAEAQAVIDAATAMRDALLAAQDGEPEGEAA